MSITAIGGSQPCCSVSARLCAIAVAFTLYSLALYFFVLALLILAKASGIVRQALIPGLVDEVDDLVAANSYLARLGVVAGGVGGGVGASVAAFSSPAVTLGLAAAAFVAAAAATSRLPDPIRHLEVTPTVEYEELHAPRIVATAWAFTAVRAAVGFFTFGLAFALRRDSRSAWMYAAAAIAYGVGSYVGNMAAPVLRTRYREVRLVAGSLVALAVVAVFATLGPSSPNVLALAAVLGGAASVARQGFDSLVQSQAPDATRGRAFARFETRFQIGWVLGAIAAVAGRVPIQVSMAIVAGALLPSATLYLRAIREAREAHAADPFDPAELARRRLELRRRMASSRTGPPDDDGPRQRARTQPSRGGRRADRRAAARRRQLQHDSRRGTPSRRDATSTDCWTTSARLVDETAPAIRLSGSPRSRPPTDSRRRRPR